MKKRERWLEIGKKKRRRSGKNAFSFVINS
jgi:hypothetical protein